MILGCKAIGEPSIINSLELESDPMFGGEMGVTLRNGHFGNKFGAPWEHWEGWYKEEATGQERPKVLGYLREATEETWAPPQNEHVPAENLTWAGKRLQAQPQISQEITFFIGKKLIFNRKSESGCCFHSRKGFWRYNHWNAIRKLIHIHFSFH